MAQLIKIKSGSSGAAPGSLLTGEPAYSINDNKLYIGNGSSVVRVDAGSYTAECSTAAATSAKTVNCAGFILFKGVEITIKFTVTNTAAVSNLTLNVGGTGAKPIRYRGTYLLSPSTLSKNRVYKFYYGGNNWELIGDLDIDTTVATELALHTGDTDNPHGTTFANLAGTNPTTISGYGITDAYTETEINNFFAGTTAISGYNKSNWDTAYDWGDHASAGYAAASALSSHLSASNPHSVTKSQVGLGNVLNVASYSKTESDGRYLPFSGGTLTGDLSIRTGNTDKYITFDYSGNNTYNWRIGYLGTGTGDANYFTIQSSKSTGGVYFDALRLGLETLNAQFFGTVTAPTFSGSLSGNASTATTLATAREINGTSFNGSANITTARWGTARNIGIVNSDGTGTAVTTSVNGSANVNLKLPATIKASLTGNASSATYASAVTLTADNTTNATRYPLFVSAATGNLSPRTDTGFKYNPSTGALTANTFIGALTGNASTATTLETERTIWGQSFNGGANVTGNISNTGNITPLATAAHNIGTSSLMYEKAYIRRIDTQSGYNLRLNVAGSEYMTINTSGNVGIGTTSPAYKLDVSGTGHYTSNLSVGGTLGVTGNTTLSGTLGVTGATTLSTAKVTNQLNFGSSENDKWINFHGSATLHDITAFNLSIKHDTPFIDFYFEEVGVKVGENWVATSRIIESDAGVLEIQASVKIPSSKYWQIGDARLTYEVVEGVGFLKLAHSNGTTPMHLVTTGGQTMYSTGVPATGGGGGATILLNGVTYGEGSTANIYSPPSPGYPGYILKAADPSGFPEWVNISNLLPDATTSVKGVAKLSGSGSATTVARSDHNHSGVYAAASHGHATLFYTELRYTDSYSDTHNVLGYSGTSNYDITLGNDTYKTIIDGSPIVLNPFISYTGFVKCTNGTLSIDTSTYSLSSHTHSYLPLSGGTVTGSLSVNTLAITNDSGVSHLAFGRGSYNYITMPASGLLGILPNGQGIGATNGMWFSSSGLHPGTNNTYMVGTSSNRFSQVHATTIYEAGETLSSKYAASSHTHSYLPLAGGSISGNLVVGHATDLNAVRLQTGVMNANPALGALVASGVFSIVAQETNSFGLHTWVRNTGDTYLQSGRGDANTAAYNIVLNALGGKVGVGMVPTTSFEVAGTVQASADYFTKADYGGFGWKNSSNTVTNYLYLDDDDSYIHFQLGEGLKIDNDVIFTDGIIYGAVVGNYGVCSTAESTGAKTVTISGFRLATGVQINVKFSNNNYAYPITLNVSGTGAKTVKAYGDNDEQYFLEQIQAGAVVPFVYDGTYWVIPTTPSMY